MQDASQEEDRTKAGLGSANDKGRGQSWTAGKSQEHQGARINDQSFEPTTTQANETADLKTGLRVARFSESKARFGAMCFSIRSQA
jgi:hypothetical protein